MTDSRLFLDSSVWLAYILGESMPLKQFIESTDELLFTSILSMYELWRRLQKGGWQEKEIYRALEFVLINSQTALLNFEVCVQAAKESLKTGLATVDSLIYASATANHATLLTLDNDFRGLKNAIVLDAGN
ncbi:MAG TPA: type II toxin-antitoxin system VapC family toxin [Candidatus Diapherotrites archaeon]|uniref:PIN domain-containing protein n=1 Tax=Candidatus Iainarchaeum sp. TaxID=3101447 RepID=A0A7J4JG46_9ARCH|nr:PIN domain-containing protein [Candidatus Diapherotrites archaeon]HIH16090.1 type II toxin-antitoxin system VapC family toxin [Candidatus Diapherotrites archaeon]